MNKHGGGYFLLLLGTGMVIGLCKPSYFPLVAISLINCDKKNLWKNILVIILAAIPGYLWNISVKHLIPTLTKVSSMPEEQVNWILRHPFRYMRLFFDSLIQQGKIYYFQLFTFAWLNRFSSFLMIAYSAFGFAMVFKHSRSQKIDLTWKKILWIFFVGLGTIGLVFTSMYIAWNELGSIKPIFGVQGRYFIPLLFPLVLILNNIFKNKIDLIVKKESYLLNINFFLLVYFCYFYINSFWCI